MKTEQVVFESRRVYYLLPPESLSVDFLRTMAERTKSNIVVMSDFNWQDDMSPWAMEAVVRGGKSFSGNGKTFLSELKEQCVTFERQNGLTDVRRTLAGVSLSGLFAVWAAAQDDFFHNVVSVSGSFWYEGFAEWLSGRSTERERLGAGRRVYLSIGDKESQSKNKYFKTAAEKTAAVGQTLIGMGFGVCQETLPGNHHGDCEGKLSKGLMWIAEQTADKV